MALNFDKLKSLFVVSEQDTSKIDETGTKKEESTKNTTNQKTTSNDSTKNGVTWKINNPTTTNVTSTNNNAQDTPSGGTFNQQIFDSLTKAIVDANLPGEDYVEYAESLKAMKDIPLDEKIKIQTVFATLSTKGLTVQTVIDSADYYLKVLENEKTKFYDAMNSQTQGMVVKKQNDIDGMDKQIKAKSEQIAFLTQEITKNQEEIERIKGEINQATSKIKSAEGSFLFTFEFIANQIKENLQKIKSVTGK